MEVLRFTLDKKRKRKKRVKPTRLDPYFPTNTWTQGVQTADINLTGATNVFTVTSDGYDYVDIRTLIYKLNEIIDYIKGEK